jgi:outer membrane protein OmpA-like peptidoglycan-associated protein
LSEARAQAVFDALQARDVTNDLRPRGFGETRLKVANDENDPAAQQENRRIEFRIIG